MKTRKILINISIVTFLVTIVAFRLVSNKNGYDNQLKMVSELSNTIPVNVDTVKNLQLTEYMDVSGTFEPCRIVTILSEVQGRITTIYVNPGDEVTSGQVLASTDCETSKAQLDEVTFNLEKAKRDMQRFENLAKGDAISAQQYENAKQSLLSSQSAYENARAQYENSFIKAPFAGTITKKYIDKGTLLLPASAVFEIVQTGTMKFVAKLSIGEVEKIRKGLPLAVTADLYPKVTYRGKISTIDVNADDSKRYQFEIEVENQKDHPLLPGMFGKASLNNESKDVTLVIPRKAINGSIKNPEVFVVKGDSVQVQKITIKNTADQLVAVSEGLKKGDIIVTSGQINLADGSKVVINK